MYVRTAVVYSSPCPRLEKKSFQVVVAISGFYVGLYGLFKGLSALFSSPKKEEGERQLRRSDVATIFGTKRSPYR